MSGFHPARNLGGGGGELDLGQSFIYIDVVLNAHLLYLLTTPIHVQFYEFGNSRN